VTVHCSRGGTGPLSLASTQLCSCLLCRYVLSEAATWNQAPQSEGEPQAAAAVLLCSCSMGMWLDRHSSLWGCGGERTIPFSCMYQG
jgi:hypothetical protein